MNRASAVRMRLAAAALVIALSACRAGETGQSTEAESAAAEAGPPGLSPAQRSPELKIDVQLSKNLYVVGEDISLEVRVTNDGTNPAEIPDPFDTRNSQPVYHVSGTQTREFSGWSAMKKSPDTPPPDAGDMIKTTIGPGETIEEDIPFSDWAHLREPGEYSIQVALDAPEASVRSEKVDFQLELLNAEFASLGVDHKIGKDEVNVELLHTGSDGMRVYRTLFIEDRPDLGEARPFATSLVCEAGSSALQILAPWANYDRMEELHSWRAWVEDDAMVAHSPMADAPIRLSLGGPVLSIVRPAWMSRDGRLEVASVVGETPELMLTRFTAPSSGQGPGEGRVIWRHALDRAPVGSKCVLSSESAGGSLYIAWITQSGEDVKIHMMSDSNGDAPGKVREATIPKAYAVEFSSPGIAVDDDGTVRVGALLMGEGTETNITTEDVEVIYLLLAECIFPPGGASAGQATRTHVATLTDPPTTATVSYSAAPGGSGQSPFWIAWKTGREFVAGRIGADAATFELGGVPSVPLDLLALKSSVYLLMLDPERGAELAAVPVATE